MRIGVYVLYDLFVLFTSNETYKISRRNFNNDALPSL